MSIWDIALAAFTVIVVSIALRAAYRAAIRDLMGPCVFQIYFIDVGMLCCGHTTGYKARYDMVTGKTHVYDVGWGDYERT
jgi:hypothetical protein